MTVEYASGSIRFDGLGSDTNFTEMIEKLQKVEMRQVNQLMRWKKDWQTRLEAFKELRGELMNLQSALLELNTMTKFMDKPAVSSKESVAVATAEAECLDQTYSIEVNQLARNYIWSTETGLHELKDVVCSGPGDGSFSYSYKGKTRTIAVPPGTTIEGLKNLINKDSKNLGVRVQLLQRPDGITFQLQGKDTGKANTLYVKSTSGLEGLDVTLSNIKYDDNQENKMQLKNGVASGSTLIFEPPSDPSDPPRTANETFVYMVDDKRFTVEITPTMTYDQLCTEINSKHPGLASMVPDGSSPPQYFFTLEKPDTTYTIGDTDSSNTEYSDLLTETFDSDSEKILDPSDPPTRDYKFTITGTDGSTHNATITIDHDTTYRSLINSIKSEMGSKADVTMEKVTVGGVDKWQIKVTPKPKVHRVHIEDGTNPELAYEIPSAVGWTNRPGQDAQLRVDGYPADGWLTVPNNSIKAGEVVDGLNLTLRGEGEDAKTSISVTTDTAKIKENIEKFVEAYNNFVTVLKKLTDYDAEKEVYDPEYAESQFEMQKGGVLQGNYGVQTVASKLKQAMSGKSPGFTNIVYDALGGYISGDLFSSLAQIGIYTNAEQGSTNYGMLEINYQPGFKGMKSLTDCLNQDPLAVARLFSSKDYGTTNTSYFSYNSHMNGITKAGTYKVEYSVDSGGNLTGTINGRPAKWDPVTRQLGLYEKDNPANGIVVDVGVIAPSSEPYIGYVSIQDGKVNEVLSMLSGSEGMLGSNGTLRLLEKNYQKIIDGIDKKIKQEDDRLVRWKRTMTMKFSRLETVLGQYNTLNESVKSQIAQLNANNK